MHEALIWRHPVPPGEHHATTCHGEKERRDDTMDAGPARGALQRTRAVAQQQPPTSVPPNGASSRTSSPSPMRACSGSISTSSAIRRIWASGEIVSPRYASWAPSGGGHGLSRTLENGSEAPRPLWSGSRAVGDKETED